MDARLVASRLPAIPMYGQPFNASPFPAGYLPYGPGDASAFYSPLAAGENADAWRAGLTQAAAAAYYDPAFAAHYGYGYGPMALSDGARRKNATRETTSTLKAWLNEHRKNPYPTKGEKIMLAIITKMTLTQVSTWFANARRRLKKENKMTWSPRNRCGEDDDDDVMDGDDDNLNDNATHRNDSDRNGSRCSTPNATTKTPADNRHRLSSFDLPHQAPRHPFLPRPEITGSFTIQGPAGGAPSGPSRPMHDDQTRRNVPEDEEEIDLESVDEDRKDTAFVKRSRSTEIHQSGEDNSHRRGPSPSSRVGSKVPSQLPFHPATSNSSLARGLTSSQTHSLQHTNPALGQSRIARRDSVSPRSHPYSRNSVTSPASSLASVSSANSPSKPKIWSLADVATSNDNTKNNKSENATSVNATISSSSPTPGMAAMFAGNAGRGPMQGLPAPHHQSNLNPEAHATIRNWMDGMMQQKMAAAAAAAAAMSGGQAPPPAFFPGGLLPQHLAAALNPALAMAASLPRGPESGRFPHPFPGFAEFAAAQRAQMTASHIAELQAHTGTGMQRSSPMAPTSAHKPIIDSTTQRLRMISTEEKLRSPTSIASSSPSEVAELSAFTALNNRPGSGDSGIASAETSKENLSQANEAKGTK